MEKKIFTNYVTDKGIVPRTFKSLKCTEHQGTKQPNLKNVRQYETDFSKDETQMPEETLKGMCSLLSYQNNTN